MGFFGKQIYEETNVELSMKMMATIKIAFPEKSEKELYRMSFESLRGLYGRAVQVIKSMPKHLDEEPVKKYDEWRDYQEEEEYRDSRNGRH